jgi:p-aminobenzoyl-glutamate transporter AbgT
MNRVCGFLSLFLLCVILVLVVGSWILSAWGVVVRGVLQPEGIRWFFVTLPQVWSTSTVALLLLLFSALGCMEASGLWGAFRSHFPVVRRGEEGRASLGYRQRLAFGWSIFFWVLFLLPYVLLACTPHSLLLSITGNLWHRSPFINTLPYVLLFSWVVQSLLYALLCGRLTTLSRLSQLLTYGIARYAPLLILYLEAQLLYTVFKYVVL